MRLIPFLALAALFASPLGAEPNEAKAIPQAAPAKPVPFTTPESFYFVKNSCPDLSPKLVGVVMTTRADFDEVFHPAPVMGKNAPKPIAADAFDGHFAIALIQQTHSENRKITINSIRLDGTTLVIDFTNTLVAKDIGFDMNVFALALVKRCEFTKLRFTEAGQEKPIGFHRMGAAAEK